MFFNLIFHIIFYDFNTYYFIAAFYAFMVHKMYFLFIKEINSKGCVNSSRDYDSRIFVKKRFSRQILFTGFIIELTYLSFYLKFFSSRDVNGNVFIVLILYFSKQTAHQKIFLTHHTVL